MYNKRHKVSIIQYISTKQKLFRRVGLVTLRKDKYYRTSWARGSHCFCFT